MTLLRHSVEWGLAPLILGYFLLVNTFTTVLLGCASRNLLTHQRVASRQRRWLLLSSPVLPRISMLAPAYNEEDTIVAAVTSLLTLSYPALEIVVVNDASTDRTLVRLQKAFDLVQIPAAFRLHVGTQTVRAVWRSRTEPHLVVLDKDNGGKADALNAALNVSSGELVCAIDADTLVESDGLLRMVRPFLDDPSCLAVGGTIRVVNGSDVRDGRVTTLRTPGTWLAGIQAVEYLRAFLLGRLGWNSLGGNLIISGAFGLFRRDAVIEIGGYLHDTVGEDMELVAKLRRHAPRRSPQAIRFVPDPVAWTEVPQRLRELGRQRHRWQRGLTDVLLRYRTSIFNPRDGRLGLVVYPYFLLVEWLAPIVEATGLLLLAVGLPLGLVDHNFAIAFFIVAYLWGIVLSVWAVLMDSVAFPEKHTPRGDALLAFWAVLEQFGYRQLTIVWRLGGMGSQLLSRTPVWGEMTRRGFREEQEDVQSE